MRILWLGHNLAYPPVRGVLQRDYNLLRQAAKSCEVHVLAFDQPGTRPAGVSPEDCVRGLQKFCKGVEWVPLSQGRLKANRYWLACRGIAFHHPFDIQWLRSREMVEKLRKTLDYTPFDVVHFDTLGLVQYRSLVRNSATVLNHHNIESSMMIRRASNARNMLARYYFGREAQRLSKAEQRWCPQFEANLVVSTDDEQELKTRVPGVQTAVVTNGVFTLDLMTLLKKTALRMFPARMTFHLKKYHYGRTVPSFWEPDVEPLKCLVRPGDLVIDIGSHVGWYTNILSLLVGEHGAVYSIEPMPETFQLLSAMIKKLQLTNVLLINCAISEKDGYAVMEVPLNDSGVENFYQARIVDGQEVDLPLQRCDVQMRSIDSLLVGLPKAPTLIKCDVEGHELSVIKGAGQTIGKCRPAWLMEVSGNPDAKGSSADELFSILREVNYRGYWFDGEALRARSAGDRAINYFFLEPSHVTQIQSSGMFVKN